MTQHEALTILKTGANVYLTGEPGAGKTYTIEQYVSYLREHSIEPAITASTGIAATHIHGMTIHSWSGIGIKRKLSEYDVDQIASNEYVARRIGKTKVLIVDEVSMLDGATLDMVDRVCRAVKSSESPFGGIQVVLVGDFFQLPPISREESEPHFAFDAVVWDELKPIICYIDEQHRQDDTRFLSFLTAVRANNIGEEHHEYLQSRIYHYDDVPDGIPKLFPHNANVDLLNEHELGQLTTDSHVYEMESEGAPALVQSLTRSCLSPEKLMLKVGAVVMFTKNNPTLGFANGTLGVVVGFDPYDSYPIIETRDGRMITAAPMDWIVEENGKIRARIVQVPLRLAWAMTIHKSQGMSLDAAVMDLSHSFEYGQGYVALSRVRSLSGLYLIGWNEKSLLVHPVILEKDTTFKNQSEIAGKLFGSMSQAELQTMHENFILTSGGVIIAVAKKNKKEVSGGKKKGVVRAAREARRPKGSTYQETLTLLEQHNSPQTIAETRGIALQTVWGHIEHLIEAGQLDLAAITPFVSKELQQSFPRIHAAFTELDTQGLAPVKNYFSDEFSYEDLRIARLFYTKST